ncbi:MAG: lysophospholipid acyltransferase family protein [Leptospiraceae bacterium]|nr:lysophospholipid acyltransferase family protein [Leptospiraceae bacterium]
MKALKQILYSREFQTLHELAKTHKQKPLGNLIEGIRDELDLKIILSLRERERIPAQGRLLIVANHPLAFLDQVALYTVIADIRKDIIVVADNLHAASPDSPDLILHRNKENALRTMRSIYRALSAEKAVILFPAVSRHWGLRQIKDGQWHKSVAKIVTNWQTPVLPAWISARNRPTHYLWTWLTGLYSDMSLDSEIVSQKHRQISLSISHPVMPDAMRGIKAAIATKLLREHVQLIGRGRQGTFKTTRNIIHPTDKKAISSDIAKAELLGETDDKIRILLADYAGAPALMREIGRLRELTFRKVGEGTGKKIDLDEFDQWYKHIVLWDPAEFEVVGAYRLAAGDTVYDQHGAEGFYTATLFRYSEEFEKYLPHALELGRSFVQPAYWNSQALDYLWHGIGAFIAKNPQYKYLFGPVSVSASYSPEARELLVYFYRKWFSTVDSLVRAKHRFSFSKGSEQKLSSLLSATDYKQAFKELKQNLKHYGYAVPTLYKQYTELCDEGGVRFFDFSIDKDFANSLDGFIFLDIDKIREAKLERYIYSKIAKQAWSDARRQYANA